MAEGDEEMARKPKAPPVPKLVDDDGVREIFATDVVGAGVISGCISINLAAHRWSVAEPGKNPEVHRALVARLVLSREAAVQLAQSLANLSRAGQGDQTAATPKGKK
ncbi:MAG: hypothetical protein MPJ78_09270 [Hyphomicrobiaceae bacterium]|nr:hypothetical protein [Hyphomicrobiaceae bacterium]